MQDLQALYTAILNGDAKASKLIVEQALAAGEDPQKLVTSYMIPAMDEVGKKFESGEYFVPELLIAARAMKGGLQIITPLLTARGTEPLGRIVVGTVKGDLHDIGKNLVSAMLEGGGFQVIDLGVDVSPEKFITAIREKNATVVALSALLTTTMPMMKTTMEELDKSGLRGRVKVMIGGAPVTQKFADDIGADGYADNAAACVSLARKLVGK